MVAGDKDREQAGERGTADGKEPDAIASVTERSRTPKGNAASGCGKARTKRPGGKAASLASLGLEVAASGDLEDLHEFHGLHQARAVPPFAEGRTYNESRHQGAASARNLEAETSNPNPWRDGLKP